MNGRPRFRWSGGFTAVELMTVLAILAIVAVTMGPQLRPLIGLVQLRMASYDLTSDLLLARSEALKRTAAVRVAPRSGTAWTSGWSVTTSGVDTPLSQRNSLGYAVTASTAPTSVTFDINGRVNATGVVRFGFTNGRSHRCISLDPSGRPRTSTSACPT